MKLSLAFAVVFFAINSSAFASLAPSESYQPKPQPEQQLRAIDSRLRSAFLLRVVGTPQGYNRADAGSLRAQLQTHFNAVLEILEANRERSLAIALARLEQRQGIRWSTAQHKYWYRYLSKQRDQNIQRLTAYRDRGLFPLNEGHAAQAVPIFVDKHDTACAVGHLMHESGWDREVELFGATNLFVYVTDISGGPLVNWVLQSGLTQGEAALIQPAYSLPSAQFSMDTLSGTGAGFNAPATFSNGTSETTVPEGLRYENFVYRKLNNIVAEPGIEFPPGSGNFFFGGITGNWQTSSGSGVRTDYEVIREPDFGYPYNAASGSNLMTWLVGSSSELAAYALSFDVVANHSSLNINRIGAYFPAGFNFGFVEAWTFVTEPPAMIDVTAFPYKIGGPISTTMAAPETLLGSVHVAPFWENLPAPENDSLFISPRERVTVHSFVLVRDEIPQQLSNRFGALAHEVWVTQVPEPTSGVILLGTFVLGLLWRWDK